METLVSVAPASQGVLNRRRRSAGRRALSFNDVCAALTEDRNAFFEAVLPGLDDARRSEVLGEIEREFVARPIVCDGIRGLLAYLAPQATLCVLTNNGTGRATRALRRTDLLHYFDGRVYGEASKPKPDVLLRIMCDFDCRPEDVIVCGDSHLDVECAHWAKVAAIQVDWHGIHTRRHALATHGIVRTPAELRAGLARWLSR